MKRQELLDKKKKMLLTLCLSFSIAIVILIIWVLFFNNKIYMKNYNRGYLNVKYDDTWKVSKSDDTSITLTHSTNSIVDIKISKLTSKNKNSDISLIKEEVRYDIMKNNSSYVLINEEESSVTSNNYSAYKMLFEANDAQNLTIVFKNDKYLCVLNYTALNEYFDILLNSVHSIIGSIELK